MATTAVPYSPNSGVIITGGGSGIGKATAMALGQAGRPVACWDLNAGTAEAVAKEVTAEFGGTAVGIGIDVRDTARFESAVAESRTAMGTIGGFVHCAGITGVGAVDQLDEEVWDATLGIHLKAAALLIRTLVPDLEANPGSAIVLISSIEGIIAHDAIASYCSAKAGMLGLTRTTAARLGPRGIRANAICPGFILTPMFAPTLDRGEDVQTTYENRIPLRRLGRPEDIGRTARFLLSDDAAYITAAEIVVDGGVTRVTF
jgi:NAD(P)-dependent dehydrogenase (short-subunit alcohol dehydrogenase family)